MQSPISAGRGRGVLTLLTKLPQQAGYGRIVADLSCIAGAL